ncbi:MAG: ferrous iron transport protein A [Pseudomonadota bacterium]
MGTQQKITLDKLLPGQEAEIVDVTLVGADLQRLLDMGFLEGTQIKMVRNAPLKDPIDVQIRGYLVALRRREASGVEVSAHAI